MASTTDPLTVSIPLGRLQHIEADLQVPPAPLGLVIFAHGSGSSRFSARNRAVAQALAARGFATLLLDLLTREEESLDTHTGTMRFAIGLLAERIGAATAWAGEREDIQGLPLGYFGASTGAAAALAAAAARPSVRAVVSRGGRPDLAGPALPSVQSPTLLIVGGDDEAVIRLNEDALLSMRCVTQLRLVPGATHLFEEPGALEQVEQLAGEWFGRHLALPGAPATSADLANP
jgi:dienelactone hydrolase